MQHVACNILGSCCNMSSRAGQTNATLCNMVAKRTHMLRATMLHQHVASFWPGLYQHLCSLLDFDECTERSTNECSQNALCTNTDGAYVCRCLKGYEGDGRMCTGGPDSQRLGKGFKICQYYATPCHPMLCYAMLCHARPCHGMLFYVMLCYAMPCHAMPCHAMPCHAMPCHAMPCHAMLFYSILFYAMPCYAMLCYAMLCYAMLCVAMLSYAMLCYALLCYPMLCYAVLCYAMLCYAMLCYAMLCYAMLCYAVLCFALFWMPCYNMPKWYNMMVMIAMIINILR